jgi:hypothetical protein
MNHMPLGLQHFCQETLLNPKGTRTTIGCVLDNQLIVFFSIETNKHCH